MARIVVPGFESRGNSTTFLLHPCSPGLCLAHVGQSIVLHGAPLSCRIQSSLELGLDWLHRRNCNYCIYRSWKGYKAWQLALSFDKLYTTFQARNNMAARINHRFNYPELSYDTEPNFQPCIKVSVFFKKLHSVSYEAFFEHWQTVHADLVAATKAFQRNILRYVQVRRPFYFLLNFFGPRH